MKYLSVNQQLCLYFKWFYVFLRNCNHLNPENFNIQLKIFHNIFLQKTKLTKIQNSV